jgi:hypothetical protein
MITRMSSMAMWSGAVSAFMASAGVQVYAPEVRVPAPEGAMASTASSRLWLWRIALRWFVRSLVTFVLISITALAIDSPISGDFLIDMPALAVFFGAPMLLVLGVALAASLAPRQWIFRVTVVSSVVVFVMSWEWMFLDSFRQVIGLAVWQLAAGVLISCADWRDPFGAPTWAGRGPS